MQICVWFRRLEAGWSRYVFVSMIDISILCLVGGVKDKYVIGGPHVSSSLSFFLPTTVVLCMVVAPATVDVGTGHNTAPCPALPRPA